MSSNFIVTVLGLPEFPTIREVNVRSGPSVNRELLFKAALSLRGTVEAVEPDADKQGKDGKTYQWFKVKFFDGRTGYVRDDLIEIEGDGSSYGYPFVAQRTQAFKFTRQAVQVAAPTRQVTLPPKPTTPTTPPAQPSQPQPPTQPETPAAPANPFGNAQVSRPVNAEPTAPAPATPTQPVTPPAPAAPASVVVNITPAQPATPPAPAAPSAPAPAPVTPAAPAADNTGPAKAVTMAMGTTRVRSGPGVSNAEVTTLPYRTEVEVLGVAKDQDARSRLRWVNIRVQGKTGWTREDFLRLTGGNYESVGVGFHDSFPAPVVNSYWVRDYNLDPSFTFVHYGWDLSGAVGEPLFAPPVTSKVVVASLCKACTPDRPNAQAHGFPTSDQRILNSADWNYGYGHMVGLRVLHEHLPASAQAELARRNLAGYHLYIVYAHMNSIDVQAGAQLQPGQRIGTMGNTGNSEGPHLHLEVRAWNNPNETSLGASFKNHLTPAVVFRR